MLVATPIGNLGDLSARAIEALGEADQWIVEDTRVSGKLQSHLGFKAPMRVLNDHTSDDQVARLLDWVEEADTTVLITDGGSPSVSDPGARVVDGCYDRGIAVDSVPGPSAVIDALALSGFFAQRFAFLGFLGRKPGAIRQQLEPFAESPFTLVLFESQFRVAKTLEIAGTVLGPRRYAICRELTKLHQQVFRNRLPSLPSADEVPAKGEFTIVIEGLRRSLPQEEDE